MAEAPAAQAQPAARVAGDRNDVAQPEGNNVLGQRADQALYKGVVGNLLEAVPMDAEKRVELQRTHAVVSAPFTARSLALLIGISNPVVMIGGLIWGIWAASQIEDPKIVAKAPEPAPVHAEITVGAAGD